jgi:hypothetical protein
MRTPSSSGQTVSVDTFLSYEEISRAFLDHLEKTRLVGMSYGEFWRVLQEQGKQVRGRNGKVQRDFVYRALTLDPLVEKAKPGFFVRRADPIADSR